MQLEGRKLKNIPVSTRKALQRVGQRIEGIDWGKNAPCAYTAVGKFKRVAFVLSSQEVVGLSDDEKVQMGIDVAKEWNIEIIRPDPREYPFNNALTDAGFAVHELFTFERGDKEKNEYVHTLKRFVERHQLVIPCVFEDLIRSLKNLAYDNKGKVRKHDDHSFDSLIYAISYYGEIEEETAFWKVMREKPTQAKKKEEKLPAVIEDFEAWYRKQKWQKEHPEGEEEEEFPWGEGVNLW